MITSTTVGSLGWRTEELDGCATEKVKQQKALECFNNKSGKQQGKANIIKFSYMFLQ